MADTFSHIISLQFFGQMSGDGKRCLGLTQTRNIVPLPLHGKKPDIRNRCWIDLPATMFENPAGKAMRSEEHTSELQSLMRISYAVFCLKKKKEKIANQQVADKQYTTIKYSQHT